MTAQSNVKTEKAQPVIKSAGDLRGFLAEVLLGIRSGEVDVGKATAISKIAGQITQSLAIEARAAIELRRLGADPEEEGVPLIAGEKWVWCEQCDARVTSTEAKGCKSKFCKVRGDADER